MEASFNTSLNLTPFILPTQSRLSSDLYLPQTPVNFSFSSLSPDQKVTTATKRRFDEASLSTPLSNSKKICSDNSEIDARLLCYESLSSNSLLEAIEQHNITEVREWLVKLSGSQDAGLQLVEAMLTAIKNNDWKMMRLLVNNTLFTTLIQGGEWSPPWKLVIDKPDIILEMLNHGLFSALEPIEHAEILDSAMINQHDNVVGRLIDLGLSPENRKAALYYGINQNNETIVNRALHGIEGQRRLSSRQWQDSCSRGGIFKTILRVNNNGCPASIINDLMHTSRFSQQMYESAEKHIILGHYWDIEGEYIVRNIKVDYEEAWPAIFVKSVLKSLAAFYHETNYLSNSLVIRLSQAIDLIKKPTFSKFLAYSNGEPILVETGTKTHSIFLVLWKDLLLVCNLGKGIKNHPIEVFNIEENIVTEGVISEISNEINKCKSNDIRNHFYSKVPALMHGSFSLKLSNAFSSQWQGISSQTANNCSWTSFVVGLIGIAGLQNGFEEEICSHNENKLLEPQGIEEALKNFNIWHEYHRLSEFSNYFTISAQRREQADPYLAGRIFEKMERLKGLYRCHTVLENLSRLIKQKMTEC